MIIMIFVFILLDVFIQTIYQGNFFEAEQAISKNTTFKNSFYIT